LERKWHLIAAFVMAATGFALCVVWQNDPVLGVIALCQANMGVMSIPALFWSVPTAFLPVSRRLRASRRSTQSGIWPVLHRRT
jgi:hypothetical protein